MSIHALYYLDASQMARNTFYDHLGKSRCQDKYVALKSLIALIYHQNKGRYGYRRIRAELKNRGYLINHKTVCRLMKHCGLKCQVRNRKYRSYKRGGWKNNS